MGRFIQKGTLEELNAFLTRFYLKEFIANGRSKIKFVTGSQGSGKSYFLTLSEKDALACGYLVVSLDGREVPLYDFKEIYSSILHKIDLNTVIQRWADKVIEYCGYRPEDIPEGALFLNYLASRGETDGLTRRKIRKALNEMFLNSSSCDGNYALACSMLTSSRLGYPLFPEGSEKTLFSWLYGEKELKMSEIRLAGLAPFKITKVNARRMFRSLVEVLKKAGYKGLCVYIDNFDSLLNLSGLDTIHYTKMRREDTYEIIRELIDSIDSMHNVFFVFAFAKVLFEDEDHGIKSYQALWMRIQNEIIGTKFNCFADTIDLDRFESFFFDAGVLRVIYDNFRKVYGVSDVAPVSDETLLSLKRKARDSSCGVLSLLEEEVKKEQRTEEGDSL